MKFFDDWDDDFYWKSDSTIKIQRDKDLIVENVKRKYDERSQRGIEKYNTTLYDNPDGFYAFLNHLQEELMDATLYIEKLKKMNK